MEGRTRMSTDTRPELSKKNKFWIEKHRYYELKHFCLQYPIWVKAAAGLSGLGSRPDLNDIFIRSGGTGDPTHKVAEAREYYLDRIAMIEKAAITVDPSLSDFIVVAVTENRSYHYLNTVLGIPCCKDVYYNAYREFFWNLNKLRG